MRILKAEFMLSARSREQFPRGTLPEIVIMGRSNAGKSSVINRLLNRKKLARVGNTPGVTGSVNFFKINDAFFFVDLPGYGFAKVSKEERARWGRFIEDYLTDRDTLKLAVLIVDVRRVPDDLDKVMIEWLEHNGLDFVVVANKADKLGNSERDKARKIITEGLGLADEGLVLLFSASAGMNTNRLWSIISAHVG